ncbi:hypothetical protein MASR2M32_34860 [Sphaerotilus sulfidivorans]
MPAATRLSTVREAVIDEDRDGMEELLETATGKKGSATAARVRRQPQASGIELVVGALQRGIVLLVRGRAGGQRQRTEDGVIFRMEGSHDRSPGVHRSARAARRGDQ